MAFATVFWIPSNIEPVFWLAIFVICAYLIARMCSRKHFVHGFMVSIFNSVLITGIHVMLFDTYVANHPEELARMTAAMPAANPRLMMLILGPLFGAGFGVVLGLFAFLVSKLVKKPNP